MEQYEDLILELTALAMKANRVTNHHFIVGFSGHVNMVEIYYLKNGHKENAKNRICLLDLWGNSDKDVLGKLEKCKRNLIDLIEGSENNGKLSDSM